MAKGSRDVILRDRLQFDIDAVTGDTALVYGRVDMSDYVSIVKNEGLAIKEIRFQPRAPDQVLGDWPQWMIDFTAPGAESANLKIFATTTAYENVADVGIGSPNVICLLNRQCTQLQDGAAPGLSGGTVTEWNWYGTPDLHPEGYDIVTDLLIGVAANGVTRLQGTTAELDIMIIAEPKKITSKDLTQMLTQAQDL
jgi:hypothetical protein